MNELSLFTGIGGGLLGTKLLGWRCVGAVEIDAYCCQVLEQRIEDGCFEPFPIWNIDIREFNEKYAEMYTGLVDVITGGDPCQANSNARPQGDSKVKSLASEYIEAVRIIRPTWVFRENPAAVRRFAPSTGDWFQRELESLAYTCFQIKIRACCLGADHRRERLFVFGELSDTMRSGLQGDVIEKMARSTEEGICNITKQDRWYSTPRICRGVDGVPHRVDRLKAIGNAQVPAVVKTVWELLT